MSNKYSRICIFCIVMMLALLGIASAEKASGTSGNFSWTLSDDGVLTISGEGEMEDRELTDGDSQGYLPWDEQKNYITSVKIKSGITSIGDGAFYNYSSLISIEIPDSVTSIGKQAFSGCDSLTSIELPDSLTSIGEFAFNWCRSLTSIEADLNNQCYSSIDGVLYNKEKTEIILVPGGKTKVEIPDGVTSIGNKAFYGCSSLTSIEISDSVTSIGNSAFFDCSCLTSIVIPASVTSIGGYAFCECSSLTSIELSDGLMSIGERAFDECSSLTSIELPDSLTSIGEYAFRGCSCLTSIEIPASVTSIGNDAFSAVGSSLTSIIVDTNNQYYSSIDGVLYDKDKSILIFVPRGKKEIEIPNSVTSIGNRAFLGCNNLASIELPDSLTSIGEYAFWWCSSLTSIELSDSLTSIGDSAFHGCSSLTSIEIPSGVMSIGDSAFYGCGRLTSIEIPSGVTSIGDSAFYGCGRLTSIEIPNSVTSIGNKAFYDSGLTSIIIPDSVTSIGESTFNCCSSLISIEIPSSVTSIGEWAFGNCSSLTGIEIPASVMSIGDRAFCNCSSLINITVDLNNQYYSSLDGVLYNKEKTELICVPDEKEKIEIPDGVTSIRSYAFEECSSLTSIKIPNSVTSIGVDAFRWCSSLTSIEIPGSVESIGSYAFSGCFSLTSIEIPVGVTSIEWGAFYYCSSLTSIKIPGNVTCIGGYAFNGCSRLASIQIPDSVMSIGQGAFSGCSSLCSIEIPDCVTGIGESAFYGCSSLISVYFRTSVIPEISYYSVFGNDTLTAYYPSTWSETPTEQYGGTITWVCVDAPSVSTQPASATKAENQSANFTVTAIGTEVSYQWQVSTDGGKTWKDSGLSGNKTNKLTVKATVARNGYMFRCLITDCVGQTVTSKAAKLTVSAGTNITISTQPKKATADEGKNAVFTVSASSSTGSELSYQWQASTDAGKTWTNSGLSGNKTATLTVAATAARNGYQFRCIVSDAAGNSVTSNAVTLTVKSYIKFNSQPLSQKVTNAAKVKFKVSAESLTGSSLSYQWQASTDGGKTWKNSGLPGNKTAILVVDATAARSGYRFRCVVTDANGKSLTSSVVVMTVKKVADQAVTITSFTASQTALAGTNVKFNVSTKSSTGTALTYQWQVSTDGGKTFKNSGLTGNKTATLTVAATTGRNNYRFRCIITDAKNNSVTSDAVKLTVK